MTEVTGLMLDGYELLVPFRGGQERAVEISIESAFFPTTRYYGSKKRLLGWMLTTINGLEFDTVLDVFGGTSTVSLLFKYMGKKVTYNDILKSSSLQAVALLSNGSADNILHLVEVFCDKVVPCQGFIAENFEGVFYYSEENEWLDGALSYLHSNFTGLEFASIYYCLQQACIQKRPFNLFHRKNLYLRENNNKKTKFGNWATWERSFKELMLRAALELKKTRYASVFEPEVLPCTDAMRLRPGYDLVYLDPPYIPVNRQDVSYLERYHFLEGMASPETWGGKIDWSKPSRCFLKTDEIKTWNTKSTFRNNLFELISIHKESIVVLSYVDGAHPPLYEIEAFFREKFRLVEVHKKPISHALSSKIKIELLIIGKP